MIHLKEKDGEYFLEIVVDGMDDLLIPVEEHEIRNLIDEMNFIYHKEDVLNYIEENNLTHLSEDDIEDIANTYHRLREENDGDEFGMSWTECLDEAFEGYEDLDEDYEDDYEDDYE